MWMSNLTNIPEATHPQHRRVTSWIRKMGKLEKLRQTCIIQKLTKIFKLLIVIYSNCHIWNIRSKITDIK